MEFFKIIDIPVSEFIIQEGVTFSNLEKVMPSMFVIETIGADILAGTSWGEFKVSLDKIMGGVRMAFLDCPNALAWTITTGYPPDRAKLILHITINRSRKPANFLEEIEEFIEDWEEGLTRALQVS